MISQNRVGTRRSRIYAYIRPCAQKKTFTQMSGRPVVEIKLGIDLRRYMVSWE